MKTIVVTGQDDDDVYPDDTARLISALAEAGYAADKAQARVLWQMYSAAMFAGWMDMDGVDLVAAVRPYFSVEV